MADFNAVYQLYFRDVYRYLLRLSGSEQVAEELTQETFFKALQAIDRFRGDCELRVWLCQIAKNCFLSACKKQRSAPLPEAEAESAEARFLEREEANQLQQILHTLPEPYKEVFMWRVYGEMSFRQIGTLFHKTENWACVTFHRAKKQIQSELEEQNHERM